MPDFAQVYSFIGSVFDPSASDHLQRLKRMDPINIETVCSERRVSVSLTIQILILNSVLLCLCSERFISMHTLSDRLSNVLLLFCQQALLLMRNLSTNLVSPEFEEHVSAPCWILYLLFGNISRLQRRVFP